MKLVTKLYSKMYRRILIALLLITLILPLKPAHAQDATGPIYIVRTGDNLYTIAARFNVSLDDLLNANGISDANQLAVGQQLVIPGLEGVTGTLDTKFINFGDSYQGLIRQTQVPDQLFRKINHVVSPSEFYVGANMIVPSQDQTQYGKSISPTAGESMLELAVANNTDVWTLAGINHLQGSWDGLPNDMFFMTGESQADNPGGLPSAFQSAQIRDLPIKQGGTTEIIVKPVDGVTLGGTLVDKPLHFFPTGDGHMVALQGILVTLTPGVYPLRLDATLPDGSSKSFEQMILVTTGDQRQDQQLVPSTDPSSITSEETQIAALASAASPTKYWDSSFVLPVGLPYCITEWFGTPRYFYYGNNNEEGTYFHSGVDYGVCSQDHPLDIFAAAPGKVVFTGLMTLRGNATVIDNGWGVYTVYAHQAEVYVAVGDNVQAGQTIGKIGATGHVTGPHLHFEMWVNGVNVNPLDWLNNAYP
jgi:murein DD-endopeptidase MepM/ murein hydrolase activator NlpD